MKPCLDCGEPSPESHCPAHTPKPWRHRRQASATARGYDAAHRRAAKRIKNIQPFCSDAHLGGCNGPLEADHTPQAWVRRDQGLSIRLQDYTVRCHYHNLLAGAARGDNVTRTD